MIRLFASSEKETDMKVFEFEILTSAPLRRIVGSEITSLAYDENLMHLVITTTNGFVSIIGAPIDVNNFEIEPGGVVESIGSVGVSFNNKRSLRPSGEAHTCIETTNDTITISGTYDDMSHAGTSFVSSEDNKKNLTSRGVVK